MGEKNMVKKNNKRGGKKKKSEIIFDEAKRRDFLTGFRKRKQERRQKAKDEHEIKLKEEIRLAKEKAKKDVHGSNKSSSNQIVPEIEHLLQQSHPTDVHDLGTHTVSVTHLDLSKTQSKEENSDSEKDDNDSGNEKEEPGTIQTSKKISKTMKKNISKSISELQTLKQKSKSSV